jgi:hypothetical protein
MTVGLDVNIEWLEAPGVTTPELAATWARYEIWAGNECITQVEAADGTFRRSVYGSLYPLAQWIASNWWLLTSHVRPSAVEARYWTWQNVGTYPWLSVHNFRSAGDTANDERPWLIGYAMARQVRRELDLDNTGQFDTSPWVRLGDVSAASNGLNGALTVTGDRCGLVLDNRRLGVTSSRFGQARALGRALAHPEHRCFVLSAARGQDEQVARAFAAELLAPADGIRTSLDVLGKHDDAALEAIAAHFKVSPLLVRHQYDNQIAMASRGNSWYL